MPIFISVKPSLKVKLSSFFISPDANQPQLVYDLLGLPNFLP